MVLLLLPGAVAAQARRGLELGVGGLFAAAREEFVGGALGLAIRGVHRERMGLTLAAGHQDGEPAGRVEPSAQFLLNPMAAGVTVYGGLGVAYVLRRGAASAGYLLLLLGVERGAARSPGWYVELGLGGGVRVAAGVRVRALRGG